MTHSLDESVRRPDGLVSLPELLAAIPYLVGFPPADSLLAVVRDSAGVPIVTACVEWPEPDAAVPVTAGLTAWLHRMEHDHVAVVAADPADPELAVAQVDRVAAALERAGIDVGPAVVMSGGTWRDSYCDVMGCGEHQVPAPQDSSIAMTLIASGSSPARDRAEIRAECGRDPQGPVVQAAADSPDRESWRDATVERVMELLSHAGSLVERDIALVAAACADIRVRDTALFRVTAGAAREGSAVWWDVWKLTVQVLRRAPEHQVAAVAAVAALAAWQTGDGVRARYALERAAEADPEHSLAALVRQAAGQGEHPRLWAEAMAQTTEEQCRHGVPAEPPAA